MATRLSESNAATERNGPKRSRPFYDSFRTTTLRANQSDLQALLWLPGLPGILLELEIPVRGPGNMISIWTMSSPERKPERWFWANNKTARFTSASQEGANCCTTLHPLFKGPPAVRNYTSSIVAITSKKDWDLKYSFFSNRFGCLPKPQQCGFMSFFLLFVGSYKIYSFLPFRSLTLILRDVLSP
ncbi:hypothetical protein CEXT_550771 [Caerostris extrusa]|uniref:Uncharacterized protein n=1 Tax=Caerostris extrusa TaxID=172846 RepID=A0AAV4TXN7_CAEEX|nr:hypothetical protein CEXT_550771 [Caerostris extrusa]